MMPIPDKTIFGGHLTEDRGISFGEVRQIPNPDIQLKYLKKRLESFLIEQVNPLGDKKVYSPFPLTIVTCIASETLGRIIEPVSSYEKDKRKKLEIPKIVSVKVYGMLDKKLTRPLTKEFKKEMQDLWPQDDIKNISSYSELFHSYLRTSFIHGYRGKNVFLTEDIESWDFQNGSLFLNPYWFWKTYKITFDFCFSKIFDTKERNNPFRINALDFFNKLINE
jgi:hypothetical protein